jgi:hypothetical protein
MQFFKSTTAEGRQSGTDDGRFDILNQSRHLMDLDGECYKSIVRNGTVIYCYEDVK